jgi:phospholipase C
MSCRLVFLPLLALGLAVSASSVTVTARPAHAAGLSKIDHIVFIVQENRSFNNLFYGFPNAVTETAGKCGSRTVTLQPQSMKTIWDISHGLQDAKTAYDKGAMDGFCDEFTQVQTKQFPYPQYAYVPKKQIEPYWEMAKEYVLGDHLFASQLDGSFVAHQYLIAGWAGGAYNYPAAGPWGCDGGVGNAVGIMNGAGQPAGISYPCFSYKTIAGELNAKKVSWLTYSPPYIKPSPNLGYYLNGYDAIKEIRESSAWTKNNLHPETRILQDVKKGKLASVTWVIPSLLLSDHAGSDSDRGPSWVASVVNAIGESRFWSSTAIFVIWDDWGGWYDGVPPPQLDADGLGERVPMICISPYAKTGYVDHTQYEFGSLLKLIEERFDLPSLRKTDARAGAPLNCFDFSQKPREFHKIQATYSVEDVIAHATDLAADDQ